MENMHLQGLFDLLCISQQQSCVHWKRHACTEQAGVGAERAGADETAQVLSCVSMLFFLSAKSGCRRVCGQSSRRWSLAAVAWQWKKRIR